MTKDELKARMTDLLKDEHGGAELPSHRSVQKLRELAEALEASIGPNVEVRLEAGHRVNRGQQYRFVVRVPSVGLKDVLLQAYVPTSGLPVVLELGEDEQPRCDKLDEVEAAILRFLARDEVKARILEVRDIAA